MYYKYKCKGKDIEVWRGSCGCDYVAIEGRIDKKFFRDIFQINEDEDRKKFFIYEDNKIYLDDYIKISKQDIIDKINNNEFVSDSEVCQMILSEGVENVRFELPIFKIDAGPIFGVVSVSNESELKACHIKESYNRMVADNYKFDFYVDDYDRTTLSHYEMYVSDFVSNLITGRARILPD